MNRPIKLSFGSPDRAAGTLDSCRCDYNGILGDKRPEGGNVLTSKVLALLAPYDGPKVIYGETSRFSAERLKQEGITFKQTPYDIKAR